jgi:protocatechuate 3,4-dioxygenase alpha subunit
MSDPTTPSQTIGPFFGVMLPLGSGDRLPAGAITVYGRVIDGDGKPVTDAVIEVWHADAYGAYSSEPGDSGMPGGFHRCSTNETGDYAFGTFKPGAVPGSNGRPQAPHLNIGVFARGLLGRLTTRMYFPDEQNANAVDPVMLSVAPVRRGTMLGRPVPPDRIYFEIRLQGDGETVFLDI